MKKLLYVLLAVTLFTACKKDEYQEKGDYVESGESVTQTSDITIESWEWTYDDLYERHYVKHYVDFGPDDMVMMYVFSGSGKQAMPYYNCVSSGAWCDQYDFATVFYDGYIEIQYTNFNSIEDGPTDDKYFDLVIIPSTLIKENPNVDFKNYEEVKQTFDL